MRALFAECLLKQMEINPKIFLLVGDLGYKMFDAIFDKFPDRTFNTGAAEQAMVSMAVGLAYTDKIPFCYSITPFLIYRPFETLRTYVNHENIPIKLVGSGRDNDYKHDGISHDSSEVKAILNTLPNIVQLYPERDEQIREMVSEMVSNNNPTFISLRR